MKENKLVYSKSQNFPYEVKLSIMSVKTNIIKGNVAPLAIAASVPIDIINKSVLDA